jgi:hypothetical protein
MRTYYWTKGMVAPLAMIFAFLSMLVTVAYLSNSVSISTMEKYRYKEITALYVAEAGLNREAADYLPLHFGGDKILIDETGEEFGEDPNGDPLGKYKNVVCSTFEPDDGRTQYIGVSTGEVHYTSINGDDIIIERDVKLVMEPSGFEKYMYFTNDEHAFGPNLYPGGVVRFGPGDILEGFVRTNSEVLRFTDSGCPDVSNLVSLEITDNMTTFEWGQCENDFEDLIDTVDFIPYPPEKGMITARENATKNFTAGDLITFNQNRQDTLIMTEIEFVESGGYWATQWWYLIPPVVGANAEIEFEYDNNPNPQSFPPDVDRNSLRLVRVDGLNYSYDAFVSGEDYQNAVALLVDRNDINNNSIQSSMSTFESGDVVSIESEDTDKSVSFIITNIVFLDPAWLLTINTSSINYSSSDDTGFEEDERVTLSRQGSSDEGNDCVPFNAFPNFHNHPNNDQNMCEVDGFHHFDFRFWLCDNRYNSETCVEKIGDNCDIDGRSFVYRPRLFYSNYGHPEVIYIEKGQVLVHGTVNGQYTIVTDDSIQYRRHDDPSIIEQIWGNIWLIDDVRYADSNPDGSVIHPDDGGTKNKLGLLSGGNVIIGNTSANGARNQYAGGSDIVINAAVMATNGAFLPQYWQNSVSDNVNWNSWNGKCYQPRTSNWTYQYSLGDGRGPWRNINSYNGAYPDEDDCPSAWYPDCRDTGGDDYRGYVRMWGLVAQNRRGYMKRNGYGPYNIFGGDIGYDKDYHYDWNLYMDPPPYWPPLINQEGKMDLVIRSYGPIEEN